MPKQVNTANVTEDAIEQELLAKSKRKELLSAILPFLGLVLTIVVLTVATGGLLLSGGNLANIVNQCFTNAIVGVGAAFVYSRGGMDFSIGSACGVAQLATIALVVKAGAPMPLAVIVGMVVSITCTMIVGYGAYMLHLQPFIVSLCVRSACTGILILGCNALGKSIRVPIETFGIFNNNAFKVVVLVLVVAIGYYLFEKTALGKELKAIGGNSMTARQSGIMPGRRVVIGHLILGICVGIAGCFQMSRAGTVSTTSGSGLEFNTMIAMALGGFPMAGGSSAKIRSAIIGVLTITFLTNGLTLAGVDMDLVNIIKGFLFIVIVAASYDRSNLKQVVFM